MQYHALIKQTVIADLLYTVVDLYVHSSGPFFDWMGGGGVLQNPPPPSPSYDLVLANRMCIKHLAYKCPSWRGCPSFRGFLLTVPLHSQITLIHMHYSENSKCGHLRDPKKVSCLERCPDFRGEIIHVCIALGPSQVSSIQEVS